MFNYSEGKKISSQVHVCTSSDSTDVLSAGQTQQGSCWTIHSSLTELGDVYVNDFWDSSQSIQVWVGVV